MSKKLLQNLILFALAALPVGLLAQATIPVSGTKVTDNNGNLLTGQLVFTVTDATGTPVTYTPQGGSPTTATITIPTKRGVVQNVGGFPPQIPYPATMAPANTRYQIQVQTTGGGTTYLDLVLTNITQPFFSYDAYSAPPAITINGIGLPKLPCTPTALYHNNSASDVHDWVCSIISQSQGGSIYWTQNPSENPACQNPGQAVVSPPVGTVFCTSSMNAYATPGLVLGGPPSTSSVPGPVTIVPVSSGASLPANVPVIASNSLGGGTAATATGIAGLFGSGPTGCVLAKDGTCVLPGGAPAGSAHQVQFNGGSAFAASNALLDAPGNFTSLSVEGLPNAFLSQTNPTSNDGIFKSLQTSGNSVNAGPNYANVEAPVADFSVDWRYPLDFFDDATFFNVSPGYAINTMFEDQRFNGAGKSNKGTYIYNPFSYQMGIAIPAVYNRTTYDRLPLLVGQGVASVARQDDVLIYGSGKNQSGLPDSRAGWDWTFFNQTRGISSPINWNVFCGGWGDCHTVQSTLVYSGSEAVGSDEGNALYRNQALEDFKVWTATSPSNQATGTTQILGTYLDSSGLQGDASPLMDSTQASSQFLITSVTGPGFNNAGTLTFTGITMTPDTIGRVIHNYTQAEIPQQYNGGTTSVTITATSLTAPLTVGRGCWADSNFNEQMAITAVGTFSGGTQTATVNARYEHLTNSTSGSASYVTQGPQACKYFEALANRVASGTAPLRNWVRIIGCPTSGSCLYAVSGAGNWQKWPGGAFTDFNFPVGTTLTRDGSGHTSLTVSGVIPSLHNSFIRIHASDGSYNGDFQIAATVVSGNTIFTWANAGGAGTTTTTAPTYLLANALNLGGLTEANAAIMIPGCEIVYTGNSTTHLQDGNTLCEANNLTVASGDQLEAQHGNEPSADIEHSLVVAWTPTSSSLGSNGHFQQISGNLIDFYTWNILNVALNNGGESQLLGQGGTRLPTARFQVIEGDRIWDAFFITPAPLTDLWKVTSCPIVNLTSSTSCSIPAQPWNILDIANPHTSFQMSWQEHNQTFLINNNARDSFIDDPVNGFQMNGNDGVSSNFGNKFNSSGITTFLGDGSGNATTFNTAIGLISTSVNVGANTSHFNQTATTFAMDHILSVTGGLTVTGTTTLDPSLGGCLLATAGVVSSTGLPCGSGGGTGVSSVGLSLTGSLFTVSGSPVTTTGTLTGTLNSQSNSSIFGNFSGSSAVPSFWTLAAGANITLTPSGGTTLTISSSGGGGGLAGSGTIGFFSCWVTNTTTLGNCHLDDGITTASTLTSTEDLTVSHSGSTVITAKTTAVSGGASVFALVAPGLDAVELAGFGTGAGAGLAGVSGWFDSATGVFIWNTNLAGDLFFSTPVSGGNVGAGTGSTASILHTGFAAFASIIDSALTAGTSPICPNGTGGAFTTVGCSGGGISGGTLGFLPKYSTGGTSIVNSLCDEGITTANTFTCADTAGAAFVGAVSISSASGVGGNDEYGEGTAPAGVAANDFIYADSTAHRLKMNNNNGGAVVIASLSDLATSSAFGVVKCDGTTISCTAGVIAVIGGGGSSALSAITAATAANTIASGNNGGQVWNWAQTTASQTAMTFGETTAATGAGDLELLVKTLASSTAIPLTVINSLTGTQTLPALSVTPTWNTTGVVDAGILLNVTNTASGTGSLLLDLQIAGTSLFKVDKLGNATTGGSTAGYLQLVAGSTNTPGTSGILLQAPTSVTAMTRTLAGTAATGFSFWTNVSGVMTETLVGSSGSGNVCLVTSCVLVTPALGTPASGVATNLTGLPMTTGVTGLLAGTNGGTGVNNAARTITIAGNLSHVGAFTQTFTATANTSVTLPTSGTLSNIVTTACGTTTTCSNTVQTSPRLVQGTVALTAGTATVTGLPAFTSTTSGICVATDQTVTTSSAHCVLASTTSLTVTGNSTDTIAYHIIGN